MGRKTIPPESRKLVSSFTLSPISLVMLDNLAEHLSVDTQTTLSRSKVVDLLIQNAANRELGLTATEKHTSNYRRWKIYIGKNRYRELKACNPHSVKGLCQNSACQAVYEKEGLL
jgi:hypothetical protein